MALSKSPPVSVPVRVRQLAPGAASFQLAPLPPPQAPRLIVPSVQRCVTRCARTPVSVLLVAA